MAGAPRETVEAHLQRHAFRRAAAGLTDGQIASGAQVMRYAGSAAHSRKNHP